MYIEGIQASPTAQKSWKLRLFGLSSACALCGIIILIFGLVGFVGIACAMPNLFLFSEIWKLKTNYTGPLRAIAGLSLALFLACSGALLFVLLIEPSLLGRSSCHATFSQMNADFKSLQNALDMYKLNAGNYTTTGQGLEALVSKPSIAPIPNRWSQIMKSKPLDPWRCPYVYKFPGKKSANMPEIISKGADGIEGNEDDFSSDDP